MVEARGPWRRQARWVAVGVIVLVPAACGDDGSAEEADESAPEQSTTSTTETTTTTQPPASDGEALRSVIQDLLDQWDAAMTEVMADPVAAEADPAHPSRVALAELFTAESPYVNTFGELLNAYINQDVGRLEPGPSGVVQQTTLIDFTIASNEDPDHVSFTFCSFDDSQGVSLSTGEDRPPGVAIVQGAGEAERIDGVWRLHRLRQLGHDSQPSGTPNPCPGYVEGADE